MAKEYKIPFDTQGNLLRRANADWKQPGVLWKDNFEFDDTLIYKTYHSTRSGSIYLEFTSAKTKTRYYMFVKDFDLMLRKHTVKLGYLHGTFTFRKHGNSFGLKVLSSSVLESMR